ncbi:hypothetical protein M407DRAFT_240876, partial [Tulasnella calospora MUT 4182]
MSLCVCKEIVRNGMDNDATRSWVGEQPRWHPAQSFSSAGAGRSGAVLWRTRQRKPRAFMG